MATSCFLPRVIRHGKGKLPKGKVPVLILAVFFNVKLHLYQEKISLTQKVLA